MGFWQIGMRYNRISLVMRCYARVLDAMARATRAGLPTESFVMEVATFG